MCELHTKCTGVKITESEREWSFRTTKLILLINALKTSHDSKSVGRFYVKYCCETIVKIHYFRPNLVLHMTEIAKILNLFATFHWSKRIDKILICRKYLGCTFLCLWIAGKCDDYRSLFTHFSLSTLEIVFQ